MSDCCLTNLGCLQIPTTVIGSQGQAGAAGSVWRNGSGPPLDTLGVNGDYYVDTVTSDVYVKAAGVYTIALNIEGATGSQGGPGFTRVAYNLPDILSGSGGTSTPKTFVTIPVASTAMPQGEGSSLLLTFNVKTDNTAFNIERSIGITFGGQECISTFSNTIFISGGLLESQIKVEIIRNNTSDEAYVRLLVNGRDINGSISPYNESNFINGLDFTIANDFVIYGTQNATDTFIFSLFTVDKITA
jgi:hypothetical protein